MASNNLDILTNDLEKLNIRSINQTNDIKHAELIEQFSNDQFKNLDQIIDYKGFIFIADWGRTPCIHVLDRNFQYKSRLERKLNEKSYQYFQCMSVIKIFNMEFLGVLTDDEILFIAVGNDSEIEWHAESIRFVDHRVLTNLKQEIKSKLKQNSLRCYGLIQDDAHNNKPIHFIETWSRKLISYTESTNSFSVHSLTLPKECRLPCFRDLKIKGEYLFLNDYKISKTNDGNDCVHMFDKNIRHIACIGKDMLGGPYYLSFIDNKLYVCERKQKGSITVFENKSDSGVVPNYTLKTKYELKCEFPYFCFKLEDHFYVTQVFGDQISYRGSKKIFKFNLNEQLTS